LGETSVELTTASQVDLGIAARVLAIPGPLADVGTWDDAEAWPGQYRLYAAQPAFVCPADRAWCFALDVDPHWAGIGGGTPLINQLITAPFLDVVPADPTSQQPLYR
jgi:hypothetical protein